MKNATRPGKRLQQTMENHHAINGKTMGKPWENGDLYKKPTMLLMGKSTINQHLQ